MYYPLICDPDLKYQSCVKKMKLLISSFLLVQVSITHFVDCKKCECGIHQGSNNARIFNGQDAEEKRHPWNILIEITPLDENDQVVKSQMGEY